MSENRLAQSSSAYLRSASHQPIDWYEFGEEAFAKAKELNRLVLLDIGAVWCHWCHVIDRESYENPRIADIINQHYVAVKVDRDQRPDIDARYQSIVSAMTGQGGWPLTGLLAYDGRVLYGGTYFPPQTFEKVLLQVADIYEQQKDALMKTAIDETSQAQINEDLEANEAEEAQHPITEDVFERFIHQMKKSFDPINGGFGVQPKFPHFSTLEFMIQQALRTNQADLIEIIDKTLTEMALGGIYDQIGGGFHRYSVDREWHVPHFEKMAYDNAEALKVYAQAYRLTQNPLYAETVDGILQFTQAVLCDPVTGGFYASQDADINLEDDGDYFTWTREELHALMDAPMAALVQRYYDMTALGDMNHGPHPRVGRNVLWVRQSQDALAREFKMPSEQVQAILIAAKNLMLQHRQTRPTPFIDKTMYLNWNGMLLVGYFEAVDLLDRPDAKNFAIKTLNRLLETHVDNAHSQLLHAPGVPGFLEDYAWFIAALLKGYQATGHPPYFDAAKHWMDIALTTLEDKTHGGFFDTVKPTENSIGLLKFRRKPAEDTPSSSANALMARNLITLYWLTESEPYRETAEKTLAIFGHQFSRNGLYYAALGISLFELKHPPAKLTVLGKDASLIKAAQRWFYPGKIVQYQPEAKQSEIRYCEGQRCLAPITQAHQLEQQLETV